MTNNSKLKELCKKHGISLDKGLEIMNNLKYGGKIHKMQDGGFPLFSQNVNNFRDPSLYVHQSTLQNAGETELFGNVNDGNYLDRIKETLRIFPQASQFMDITKDSNGNITNAEFKDESSVKSFQNYAQSVYSNLQDYSNTSSRFDDAQKKQFNEYVGGLRFDDATVARAFDNKYGNFTSSRSGVALQLVTDRELKALKARGINNFSEIYDDKGKIKDDLDFLSTETIKELDGIRGKYNTNFEALLLPKKPRDVVALTPLTPGKAVVKSLDDDKIEELKPVNVTSDDINLKQLRNRFNFPILPDQSALPPEGLVPHLMVDRTFQRLDPVEISIEDNLKESARNQTFATQQLSNLPDSQRRAALANLIANVDENTNQATTKAATQNAINRQQTEQFNIGQSDKEENYRALDMLDFERRSLTGLGKTQEDIARYFDFNRQIRLGNFNTVSRLNTLNDIYENFQTDGSGIDLDESKQAVLKANYLNQLIGINR